MNPIDRDRFFLERRRKKITQKEVAEYCGCSHVWISKYENGLVNLNDQMERAYQEYIRLCKKRPRVEVKIHF